jgi:superfamily II DNA or RNA helicase
MTTTLFETKSPNPVEKKAATDRKGLRDFQSDALDAVHKSFEEFQSALICMPTGCGKTHVFTHMINERMHLGRTMVVAHRLELVQQAYKKIVDITGRHPEIEMASSWADRHDSWRAKTVVASVPTLARGRIERFDPNEFSLLVVDEAHHAPAVTYRRVIDHFTQNPKLKVLGVTATPDRSDEKAMGMVFEDAPYNYTIVEAIEDGWLVKPRQRFVHVEGLDFSQVGKTAGDLNGSQLEAVLNYEKVLHGIANPTYEMTSHMKRVLVFAASVAHAERLAEIFNRYEPDCARCVSAGTPESDRESVFNDFSTGQFRYLVNVGITTEGWDSPGIEAVIMARPTLSRCLYAQMLGRGTRPYPVKIVDRESTAEARKQAIARSAKPQVEVLDFVGNAGRHSLMSTLDVLGGDYDEGTIQAARIRAEKGPDADKGIDPTEALSQERDLEKAAEARKRKRVMATAKYSTQEKDPFKQYNVTPCVLYGWDRDRQVTEKQANILRREGVDINEMPRKHASQILDAIFKKYREPSDKQIGCLKRAGYSEDELKSMDRKACSKLITKVKENEWRRIDDNA